MRITLLLFLLCPMLCMAQIDKEYWSQSMGIGGGDIFKLRADGTYEFSTSNCLSSNSGKGAYTMAGDTVIIKSYRSDYSPFIIEQEYDKEHKDSLLIHITEDVGQKVITTVILNDRDTLYTAPRFMAEPIKFSRLYHKTKDDKLTIHYYKSTPSGTDTLHIYAGEHNTISIKTTLHPRGYFMPDILSKTMIAHKDTLYIIGYWEHLVDSSLSEDFFDAWEKSEKKK